MFFRGGKVGKGGRGGGLRLREEEEGDSMGA